jgi:uncharacterized protein (DUF697 family)/tellurite resistance protein
VAELDPSSRAQFRVLTALAQADGRVDSSELTALREVLGADGAQLDQWLTERIDVDQEIAALTKEQRRALYHSAFALAHADGNASMDEVNLLRRILPDSAESSISRQVLGEAADTLIPTRILPEADPTRRDLEINEDIIKYAVLSAVAGAMPIPVVGFVADLAVIAIQTKMVHDIGQYCGHSLDQKAIRAFMASAMGSLGLRIAVNNLARFIPGWGSVFAGGTSFVSTFALGKVAQRYFEAGKTLNESELQDLFAQHKAAGADALKGQETRIQETERSKAATLRTLNDDLAAGTLTRAQYEAKIAEL